MNNALRILLGKDLVVLDGDGTLYIGSRPLPGAREFIRFLDEHGKRYVIMTNNSSFSKEHHIKRLRRILGRFFSYDEVFISTEAAIEYLYETGVRRVYALGTPEFIHDLVSSGIHHDPERPEIVVIAFDKTLTYGKLVRAVRHIMAGTPYIVVNPDILCPTDRGYIPDTGSIWALIRTATGKDPMAVTGKPSSLFLNYMLRKLSVRPSDAVIIGDRLYTDIAMANENGVTSILVLTGETKIEDLVNSRYRPTFVVNTLIDLLK